MFGLPQFEVFGDSQEICKSDIVVALTRMQAEGKTVNQMIVQDWLPILPSVTVSTS
jgi:hypothetical protein